MFLKVRSNTIMFICHKKRACPVGAVPSGLANLRKGTPEEPTAGLPLNLNMTQQYEDVKWQQDNDSKTRDVRIGE